MEQNKRVGNSWKINFKNEISWEKSLFIRQMWKKEGKWKDVGIV